MPNDCITYQNSGYFSNLIIDYINQKKELKPLYNRFPTLENFKLQLEEKKENFSSKKRAILVEALKSQYKNIEISEYSKKNIALLLSENTFTITTGHQLNLFTGPLYFLYKIISVINLTKQLQSEYPNYNFVPIYWMATEDHDFEEINYFNLKEKKIKWDKESKGPVGRLSTKDLHSVYEEFSTILGTSENDNYLRELFKSSYLENNNLADATRFLANELFKEQGLVIIDGDSKILKKEIIPYLKEELINQISFEKVTKTKEYLKEYKIQVNPREINLFYILDNIRERILFENGNYIINNTKLSFTESEILTELENYPERFSPNVILRPIYQEAILPNLCYIGGGGELAYWLELKSNFDSNNITFPILLLRNSVLAITEKQTKKIDKLNLKWEDLFLNQKQLIDIKTKEFSKINFNFSDQKTFLRKQFSDLLKIANHTDKSFIGAVKAQEAKQLKGLEKLEKRLLKAEKRVHQDKMKRILLIQNEIFPKRSLQERSVNISELNYSQNLKNFIQILLDTLEPLKNEFSIIKI